jgi:hypothetical protein
MVHIDWLHGSETHILNIRIKHKKAERRTIQDQDQTKGYPALQEGGNPTMESLSGFWRKPVQLEFNCTKEAIFPGEEGGRDPSEDPGISLPPNFPSCHGEDFHEMFQVTVPLGFLDGVKEV